VKRTHDPYQANCANTTTARQRPLAMDQRLTKPPGIYSSALVSGVPPSPKLLGANDEGRGILQATIVGNRSAGKA
jgi:hypothetical protein